jgi:hypothetical protein
MKSLLQKLVRATVAAGLCLFAGFSANAQDDSAGIVRISKPSTAAATAAGAQVTPVGFGHWGGAGYDCQNGCPNGSGCQFGDCQSGNCPFGGCKSCFGKSWGGCQYGGCPWGGCQYGGCPWSGCNNCCRAGCGQAMCDYFRCKFGYFIPTGAGGAGVPHWGKYSRVYPQDPYYFDQRDGMAWAAQGYGMPMAVPLAPVVGHTYNYSWGTPSSRLTPVSRPAY